MYDNMNEEENEQSLANESNITGEAVKEEETEVKQTGTEITEPRVNTGGVFSGQRYSYGENASYYSRPGADANNGYGSNTSRDNKTYNTAGSSTYVNRTTPSNNGGNRETTFGKKVLATIGLGIVFGIVAGVTIFFVDKVAGIESTPNDKSVTVIDEVTDEQESVAQTTDDTDAAITDAATDSSDDVQLTGVTDVTKVVDAVMPSVVAIKGNYTVTGQTFFGQIYQQKAEGSGSGIILAQTDDKLLIATNNHVVDSADELEVQFIDETTAPAAVKGTDADMDLALIAVDLEDLTPTTKKAIKVAALGDSDALKVGEPAIAIGNALGYGQSVTAGVISAVNRSFDREDGSHAEGLIQTDAAINPGNSGGALLNVEGEVIGINSSKIGGATIDGVGFAIPISSAKPILDGLVSKNDRMQVAEAKQGYLGIQGVTVTEEASQMYGMPIGVQVRLVYEGTGAESAGLKAGDVITKIGTTKVDSMDTLKEELTYYAKGDSVTIELSRFTDGEYVDETIEVQLTDKTSLKSNE